MPNHLATQQAGLPLLLRRAQGPQLLPQLRSQLPLGGPQRRPFRAPAPFGPQRPLWLR